MRDTLSRCYTGATSRVRTATGDAKDRVTDTWLYSTVDDLAGRISSKVVGPHSYGPQEDVDDLKEDIYFFRPPKNGYDKAEYLDEVTDLLEGRKERLEQQQENPRAWRAVRIKFDEALYIMGRSGMAAGGASLAYSATFSPSFLFTLWGYTAGPGMMAGAPIGVKSAVDEINAYRDPETIQDDLEVYEAALDELDEDGVDALPDDFSKWVDVAGAGKKKLSFRLEDGEYRRN